MSTISPATAPRVPERAATLALLDDLEGALRAISRRVAFDVEKNVIIPAVERIHAHRMVLAGGAS